MKYATTKKKKKKSDEAALATLKTRSAAPAAPATPDPLLCGTFAFTPLHTAPLTHRMMRLLLRLSIDDPSPRTRIART